MVTIEVDEHTAERINVLAKAAGKTVSEYLQLLVGPRLQAHGPRWDELEKEFLQLSVDGALPPNISTADFYGDYR